MQAFRVMYISKRNDEYDTKGNQAPFDSEGPEKAEGRGISHGIHGQGRDAPFPGKPGQSLQLPDSGQPA